MENCSFVKKVRSNVATAFFASLERCYCINVATKDADDSAVLYDRREEELAGDRHGRSTFDASNNRHAPTATATRLPVSSAV